MFNWLRKFNPLKRIGTHRRVRREVSVVNLEDRILPAAILVMTTPGPRGTVNVTLTGTDENEKVALTSESDRSIVAYGAYGALFRLPNGNEVPVINLGPIHNLSINLGLGSDELTLQDVNANNVTIQDGASANDRDSIRMESRYFPTQVQDVRIMIGQGTSDVVVEAESKTLAMGKLWISGAITNGVHSSVRVGTGASMTMTNLLIETFGAESVDDVKIETNPSYGFRPEGSMLVTGSTVVRTGPQRDSVTISGKLDLRGATTIDTADGTDIVLITSKVESFEIPRVRGALTIATGEGSDFVLLGSFREDRRLTAYRAVTIDSGAGNDVVDIANSELRGSLTVNAGTASPIGDVQGDTVNLLQTEIVGTSRISALGHARISLQGRGFFPTRFRRSATFNLGSGAINVGENNVGSRIVFHSNQIYNGVSGPVQVIVPPLGFVQQNLAQRRLTGTAFLA